MIVQGELAPRTVAPEKNININAIRELANMSATSALNSHQQKKTAINSQAKLLVTLVSFTLGVALMIVWRLPHSSPYSPYWALAAFAVSAIWGVQFAKLFSQQLVERAARLDRHLKRTSEAVCTTTSEATVATEAETAAASS
jgi:VIT1/CCC1 family predicted Fe2+/Mn2+ transporter